MNKGNDVKHLKAQRYYLPKGIAKIYNFIINIKNSYDKEIDSYIKRQKEIRKLTTGQDEDYTTGCLLNYGYIKNHFKLEAIGVKRQNKLDSDVKAIQEIEFFRQFNNDYVLSTDETQSKFVIKIFRKNQRIYKFLKFSQGSTKTL